MFKRIIVAAHGDDAPTRDALALAVTLARAGHSDLLLAGVWASPLGPGDALYEGVVRAEMERELRLLLDAVPSDVGGRYHVRGSTSVVRGLHRVIDDEHADLLVLGPSHLGRVARSLRGDVALAAIHDAPCAVAVAPQGLRERPPGRDVVVGWDASDEARLALEAAIDLAGALDTTLRVVHVLESPYRYSEVPLFDPMAAPHWLESTRSVGRERLDAAEAAVAGRVRLQTVLAEGLAGPELCEAARDAAFLVTGSRGHGTLRRLVLGSTSTAVLHHATVPVLVVPRGSADVPEGPVHVAAAAR